MATYVSRRMTYHWLYFLKPSFAVKKADGIPGYQPAKGVSDNAEPLDFLAILCQSLYGFLGLLGDALAAKLDPIVGEVASVALRYKNVQGVLRKLVAQCSRNMLQMLGVPPKSDDASAIPPLSPSKINKTPQCRSEVQEVTN